MAPSPRGGGIALGRCGGVYCPSVLPPKLPIGDTGVGTGGGVIGTIGAGAGFGAVFFATVLFLAGVAVFSPFFLRAGAPRFAFLDFFAFALVFVFATFWPAPGSEYTELGVLMEPEVRHGAAEVYAGVQA